MAAVRTVVRVAADEQRDLLVVVAAERLRFSLNLLAHEHAGRQRRTVVAAVINRVVPTLEAAGIAWSVRVVLHAPTAAAAQVESQLVTQARRAGAEVLVVPSWRGYLNVHAAMRVVPAAPLRWDTHLRNGQVRAFYLNPADAVTATATCPPMLRANRSRAAG